MDIRSFLLALGTTTGLANHRGWWTSRMKPAPSSFLIFTDKVLPLNGLLLGPMLDWSGIRIDFQMVLNHLPRDPKHLRRLPGKHVDISLEEGDKREFLFTVQITRDKGCLTSFSPDLDGFYGDIFLGRGLHAGC
jgi:hypothetical protein